MDKENNNTKNNSNINGNINGNINSNINGNINSNINGNINSNINGNINSNIKSNNNTVSAIYGEGKYSISITAIRCGHDLSLTITGGTLPHIGAAALAVYEHQRNSATVSYMTVYTHRDNVLAAKCAKLAAIGIRGTASATVGIHIDDASPEELKLLQENCMKCMEFILQAVE